MPSCGEDILKLLEAYGVEHVFGIPGVHTVELYRGFARSDITHVTPRHEQGAGFMAYGYAAATGRPAACFVITGPGLANIATALGEAYSESLPMLVVATNNEMAHIGLGAGRLHETKSQSLIAEQLTGFTHQVLDQRNIGQVVGQAFSRFHSGRPRPAYIEIPLDLLDQASEIEIKSWPLAPRPRPDLAAVQKAADVISHAKRPILLLGGGSADAAEECQALAEMVGIPVVTTTAGKGTVSEDHPLSLGAALPFKPVQDYLKNSDAVLAIGTELAETDTLYTYSSYEIGENLIRIDIDPDQLTRNYRPKVPIFSDAAVALRALLESMKSVASHDRLQAGRTVVEDLKAKHTGQWIVGAAAHKRILDVLRNVLDDDAVLATEECQLGYTGNQYFKSRRPRTYIHPTGYGTLGVALPAAIGAKVALPDRQVVAIVGDGSFLFSIGELASAAELGLSLPIVIWNNDGYREIAADMDRKGVEHVGVELKTPDFVMLAKGFNCRGARPDTLEGFETALREALEVPSPTLIELHEGADFLKD